MVEPGALAVLMVFFLLLSLQEAGMRAEDAGGSLWDCDMNEEKETTPVWQEQSAPHSIGTATGPCKALISEKTLWV